MNILSEVQVMVDRLTGRSLSSQDQRQAIVDRLTGWPLHTLPPASDLEEPWRTIYRRLSRAVDRADAERLIWHATEGLEGRTTEGLDGRRQLASALIALLPGDEAFNPFRSLHDASDEFPPVDWLWPAWIPRGMLTLLGAAPGAGKSLVALDLARRIIHGEPFPDGAPVPCPGCNVLIVDAEGPPALLTQRARAWQIDRHLFVMPALRSGGFANLARPDQLRLLVEMCAQIQPALIIVDSLAAATPRGETSLQVTRALLGSLSSVAARVHIALLVVHHLRKRPRPGTARSVPRVTADDLRGSSHLAAAARSVLGLSLPAQAGTPAPPPPQTAAQAHPPSGLDGLRRLEVVKTNLCRQPPPLGLILEGGEMAVPTLRYTEYVEPAPPPTQIDLCARWLLQFLAEAGGPVKPADAIRAAAEIGFPRRTLYRARRALAGAILDLGSSLHDPHKRWTLAPEPPPPTSGSQTQNPGSRIPDPDAC
jgi:hypothetical protein